MDNSRPSNENSEPEEKPKVNSTENNENNLKNISPFMSKDLIAAAGFNVETPIVNAIIGNLTGTLPVKKSETEMIKCEICDCELSSNVVLSFHIIGSKHRKRLRALEIIAQLKDGKDKGVQLGGGENPKAFRCEICALTVNSAQQLEIHLSGAKHKKKASRASNPDPETVKLEKDSELNENTDNNASPPSPKKKKKEETKMIFCDICNLLLNSQTQYDQHLISKKHRNRTRNQQQRNIPAKKKFPPMGNQFCMNQMYQNGTHQIPSIQNRLFLHPNYLEKNQFLSHCKNEQNNCNAFRQSKPPNYLKKRIDLS